MNDLKNLANTQGGVVYIEQIEEWVEKIVDQLEEEKDIAYADFEQYAHDYFLDLDEDADDWYYKGLERAINILRKGGVE